MGEIANRRPRLDLRERCHDLVVTNPSGDSYSVGEGTVRLPVCDVLVHAGKNLGSFLFQRHDNQLNKGRGTVSKHDSIWRRLLCLPNGSPKFKPVADSGVVVAMAAFMEVLDTSSAYVVPPYLGGNLGASTDQSTWILTSYTPLQKPELPANDFMMFNLGVMLFAILW